MPLCALKALLITHLRRFLGWLSHTHAVGALDFSVFRHKDIVCWVQQFCEEFLVQDREVQSHSMLSLSRL